MRKSCLCYIREGIVFECGKERIHRIWFFSSEGLGRVAAHTGGWTIKTGPGK